MSKFTRFTLISIIIVLILYACNLVPPTDTATDPSIIANSGDILSSITLTVQAMNAGTAFNTVGQAINYSYSARNTGNTVLTGPVTVTDDKTTLPVCASLNTVGNADNNFDPNETVTCTSTYTINQADLNTGSVTNNSTARAGGIDSNRVTTNVKMAENKVLTLTVTPNPTTYNQAGQTITYTYVVKNTGVTTLGPAQFVVRDDKVSAPINCDVPTKTLASNETLTCTATYTILQNDMTATGITNTATASGAGAGTIQPATSTVTNMNVGSAPPPSGSFTRGSTIQHSVIIGEWLIQIGRCYGADFTALRNANPQVADPNLILPAQSITVPNIGSNGTIYGPPCIVFHTAQTGDTWDSIAQKYNADVVVLQAANKNVTIANGVRIRVPINSKGATTATPVPGSTRITIPAGGNTATLQGTVAASGKVRYLLATTQGQTLNVKVTAPANEVALAVIAPNGSTLKTQDTTLTWTGTIPSTGDTIIDIVSVLGTTSKSYTLEVTLTTPTASPFERVADINSGINSSDPAYLAIFNNALFMRATGNDNAGAELWKYDATTKTASRVVDTAAGSVGADPAYLTVFSNNLYFRANGNDGGGIELWRFNGSDDGRMPDINTGAADANPSYLAVFNNMLYFSAKGSDDAGTELWRTDGTSSVRAADINVGPGDSNPAYLTVFNNALYFSAASTDGMGVELWKFDGTTATRVSDINPGVGNSNPAHLAVFNNALYFSANANDGKGVELWKYDGTTTSLVADINAGAGDSAPAFLTVFNGALYFSANGDNTGIELWKYDGSTTKRVGDLNTVGNSSPSYLVVFNNELYFQANGNDGTGTELWKFKGP